jgi:hypothetical protein
MLQLEKSAVAAGIYVIGDRRSSGGDRFGEHLLNRIIEPQQVGPRQRSGTSSRPHSGPEEAFVSVDIANARE